MKLSENTLKILKNFSEINGQFLFVKGKKQKTMTPAKTFLATVEIDEDIPQDFGVYKLSQFLSLYSIFDDPKIRFEADHLVFEEGDKSARYVYCSDKVIQSPPRDKDIPLDNPLFSFSITEDQLNRLFSTARILQLPNVVFEAKDEKVTVTLMKENGSKSKDCFSESLGTVAGATDGSISVDVATLNLISDDYVVTVTKNIVHFKANKKNIEYFAVAIA